MSSRTAAAQADREMLTRHEAEILAALARIDTRLGSGDKRFDEFAAHVKECSEEKRSLSDRVSLLEGKVTELGKSVAGLRTAVFAFAGSVCVTGAILLAGLWPVLRQVWGE